MTEVLAKLVALRDKNVQRIKDYVADGGEEHYYLDGKDFAYNEAIGVVQEAIAQEVKS
jgi:hypothetical protein